MNKNKIIEEIKKYEGKLISFKYNGVRNQIEEFRGTIEEIYNSVFIIRLNDKKTLKSFTYSDVINKTLQIFI
jgi:uncharacterized protein Veg